jgi:hypothetical protein
MKIVVGTKKFPRKKKSDSQAWQISTIQEHPIFLVG